MPSNLNVIVDQPPVYGMNSVDNPLTLRQGECVRLLNAMPGNPPVIRNGCRHRLISGTSTWIFVPPAKLFRYNSINYILALVYDSDVSVNAYRFVLIPDSNTNYIELGIAKYLDEVPFFDIVTSNDMAIILQDVAMSKWNSYTYALGHKVVESISSVRDLNISVNATATSITNVGGVSGVFDIGDCFEYAFTYVRRNDSPAFESGTTPSGMILPPGVSEKPKIITTFDPGISESIESISGRLTYQVVTDGVNTKYYSRISIGTLSAHTTAILMGATHLRIHRTRKQTSIENAQGATKFYLMDVPLGTAVTTFDDKISDATLSGETNQLITGYTSAPLAKYGKYHKGRLFLFGDKVYYSEAPGIDGFTDVDLAQEKPQKWMGLFKITDYVLDLDSSESQNPMGIATIGDDIYFFREKKTYVLFGGDPTNSTPTLISNTIGCAFPFTITEADIKGVFGPCILFLSSEGPMVIVEGGRMSPLTEFKVKELWPDKNRELYSELDNYFPWIVSNCGANYWANTWYVFYKTYAGIEKKFGYYFNQDLSNNSNAPRGAFEIEFA